MTSNSINKNEPNILWLQVTSLGILNALVVFSWIAYNNYQPKILYKFNLVDLKLFLAIAQGLVMVFVPILAGMLADYFFRANAKSFIVFSVGISITAMLFMAVAFTVQGSIFEGWKMMLPILIVLWLISMNIFISPANSMIELFASAKKLPTAMAFIILLTELVAALEPSIISLIDFLGSTNTFVAGALLIALGGFFFRRSTKQFAFNRENQSEQTQSNFAVVLLVGLMLGAITGVLMNLMPSWILYKLQDLGFGSFLPNHGVSLMLGLAAVMAIPLSNFTSFYSSLKLSFIGFLLSALLLVFIFFTSGWICLLACVVLAVSYSLTCISSFPAAIEHLSKSRITVGTGVFIGATELVDQILNIINT